VTEKQNIKSGKISSGINYYILAFIGIGTVLFIIGNYYTPSVDSEFDEYELITSIGFGSATLFAFIAAKRYWGSEIFGRSYLALAIAYVFYSIGWNAWWYYEISGVNENPFVYWPDLAFIAFYPLVIYHIRKNFKYFKRDNTTNQKLLIIVIPIIITSVFAIVGILEKDDDGGLSTPMTVIGLPDEEPEKFIIQYLVAVAFVFATTLTFSHALVATQIFRTTMLEPAWGLLLLGILINMIADIYYYYIELFGGYVREDPVTGIWLLSTVIISYALVKHRRIF